MVLCSRRVVFVALLGGCASSAGSSGAPDSGPADVSATKDLPGPTVDVPTDAPTDPASGLEPDTRSDPSDGRDVAVSADGRGPDQNDGAEGAARSDGGRDLASEGPAPDGLGRDGGSGGAGGTTGSGGSGGAAGNGGATGSGGAAGASGGSRASVLEHHNHASRDGFYVDAALSRAAVAKLHLDASFANATTSGPTYTQPLYLAGIDGGPDLVIVATEQNHVYAFDASKGGKPVWDTSVGMPLPRSRLSALRAGCGNIDPLGITGTPVIDGTTRTLYLDAMTIASANATAQHQVFALDADTGAIKPGWPVDLNSTAKSGSTVFESLVQNQRGALALLDGKVYVPFGAHIGDCSDFHGWIVGVSTTDPTQVTAWVTRALAGGVWAPGGISSDGKSLFFATGNTQNKVDDFSAPPTWQDGETIFRLPPSLVSSGQNADYFTPTNWAALDEADTDLGGTAPVVFDVPGATPSALVIGLGKDGNAYLLDRNNLGGISKPLVLASVATGNIINAAAAYTTPQGTYVVFKGTGKGCPSGQSGGLAAIKVSAASPPAITMAWCGGPATQDSPAVSATDAQGTDAVVWIVSSDNKLYGLDGDTGKAVFAGGTGSDTMSTVSKFVTPIVANGRVFVAADKQVYAFTP